MKKIGNLIFPSDVSLRIRRFELLIWAFLLSLSFHPDYYGFIAWFALVRPLMIFSRLEKKELFRSAYFFSFFFNLFSLYWVGIVTLPGMVTAVAIVGFYFTFIFYSAFTVYKYNKLFGKILIPFLWVGIEYFRTLSEFAFPWSDLGYTQSYYLYIIQIVSVISVHGLSLLIVAVNVLLWQILEKNNSLERKLASGSISIGLILILLGYGWAVIPVYPEEGKHKVAILQGSVPINVKWKRGNAPYSYNLYDSLTQSVADSSIKLFVWPETSAPTYLSHDIGAQRIIGRISKKSKADHLVGGLGALIENGKEKHYNSCYHFDSTGSMVMQYNKMKLVPFSEHVPYQDHLPFLQKGFLEKYLTFIKTYDVQWWSDFYPGDSMILFKNGDLLYAPIICFESTFPEFDRQAILNGAHFLVGITNDTWFKSSIGIDMHSRIFYTRAVENRVWAVRCANSGISYIVDGYGRIREELPQNEAAVLIGNIRPLDSFSIFTEYGDIAGRLSFLITLSIGGILIILWIGRKFKK